MSQMKSKILSVQQALLKLSKWIRKRSSAALLFGLLVVTSLSCSLALPGGREPTPEIYADAFFSGHAYVDRNANGKLDSQDVPLQGALFVAAGFRARTDASGVATVVIPGGWDEPVTASMAAPEEGGYRLIGPNQVEMQSGGQTSADFLFSASEDTPVTTPTGDQELVRPTPGAVYIDLTYCTTSDGVDLKMDLYYPQQMIAPAPLVLYVHGGSWISGDKSDGTGLLFFPQLRARSYILAAINYRLSPTYQFPAHIEDVRCAMRYLRANAATYNLDPDRIGAIGGSAGGHLVSLLGLAGDDIGWQPAAYREAYADQSSRVQAVVDMFGPSDLVRLTQPDSRVRNLVFGASEGDDHLLQIYSPVTYISSESPPFLILQGDKDETVPEEQSQILYDQLTAAGVPATLVIVKNAGHGFVPTGGELDPSLNEMRDMVNDFFDQYLK
jgi:acetyl esterase/lipase